MLWGTSIDLVDPEGDYTRKITRKQLGRIIGNERRGVHFLKHKSFIHRDDFGKFPFFMVAQNFAQKLMIEKVTGFVGFNMPDNGVAQ